MLHANYAGCCDSYLWIEWLNDPQEDEVLAIIHPVSNGVRIHVERNELCDICGAETIACLRGKDNRGRANRWSASTAKSLVDGRASNKAAKSERLQ